MQQPGVRALVFDLGGVIVAHDNSVMHRRIAGRCASGYRAEDVARALEQLPTAQREVIELGFYRGLSHAQIAATLGAPLCTIKIRMRTGLKRLRLLLDAIYYETSAR